MEIIAFVIAVAVFVLVTYLLSYISSILSIWATANYGFTAGIFTGLATGAISGYLIIPTTFAVLWALTNPLTYLVFACAGAGYGSYKLAERYGNPVVVLVSK